MFIDAHKKKYIKNKIVFYTSNTQIFQYTNITHKQKTNKF